MDKNTAKRFLLSVSLLLALGYLIALIVLCLVSKDLSASALLSLIAALVPAGTYTGFVVFGLMLIKEERLTKKIIIAVCIFFPVTLAIITVSGIILIIPQSVKAVKSLKAK